MWFFKKDLLLTAVILFLTLLVYLNLFQVPFLYDDYDFLFRWEAVKNFQHLPSLIMGEVPAGHEGVYRPVRSIFYILSRQLAGGNLQVYHLQELIIYWLCIIFVYLITKRMFGRRALAFFTALIYAILPIHIDNVANLTASFDTIGAVFFFGSFYLFQIFLGSETKRNIIMLICSLFFSLMAYLTYEITLVLPLVIFLYAFFKRKNLPLPVFILYLLPFFSYFFIRTGILEITFRGTIWDNLPAKLAETARGMIGYLELIIFPAKASTPSIYNADGFFSFSNAKEARDFAPKILPTLSAAVVLMGIAGYGVWSFGKRQQTGLGVIWFLVCMLPAAAIGLQTAGTGHTQILWGKYAIIATFGIALLGATGFLKLINFCPKNGTDLYLKIAGTSLFIILIFWDATVTGNNLKLWQDARPFFYNQAQKEPEGAEKYNDLGVVYALYRRYTDAEKQFRTALKIKPDFIKASKNLENLCETVNKLPDASKLPACLNFRRN